MVDTDEEAVVRRFGAIAAEVGPGMHYRLPWPIDQVDVLKTTSVMKTGVGFVLRGDGQDATDGMEVLTGDTNILSIALALQYVIQDPADFLFRTESAEALIGAIAEAALTETVLAMPVDEVLTTGRLAIQEQVKTATQARLDEYHSGVRITSSNIMTIMLDKSVAEAFQEVTDAMADREKSRNEARMYANNLIPKTRGEAHALVREAQGVQAAAHRPGGRQHQPLPRSARGVPESPGDHAGPPLSRGDGRDPARGHDVRDQFRGGPGSGQPARGLPLTPVRASQRAVSASADDARLARPDDPTIGAARRRRHRLRITAVRELRLARPAARAQATPAGRRLSCP